MEYYFGVAKGEGITNEEIVAVQNIVMAVVAGRVSAQFQEVRKKGNKTGEPSQGCS